MNKTSYVIMEKTATGVKAIRHPYANLELAEDRAAKEAAISPGKTLYIFQAVKKIYSTMKVESEVLK